MLLQIGLKTIPVWEVLQAGLYDVRRSIAGLALVDVDRSSRTKIEPVVNRSLLVQVGESVPELL